MNLHEASLMLEAIVSDSYGVTYTPEAIEALYTAIEVLDDLWDKQKSPDAWTPCAKCTPDVPATYIVTTNDGRVMADYWNNPRGMKKSCRAWMELPEAYEEVEDG